jgi:hypothetical protein
VIVTLQMKKAVRKDPDGLFLSVEFIGYPVLGDVRQALSEAFFPPGHDDIVVPFEEGFGQGRDKVHPGFGGFYTPIVLNAGPVLIYRFELPDACSIELAKGAGLDHLEALDSDDLEIEFKLVGQRAFPCGATDAADTVGIAGFQLGHAKHAFPPFGPFFRSVYLIPDLFEPVVEVPNCDEFISGHN